MFGDLFTLSSPGLFITGTDTGVGKTVIACAIAHQLRGTAESNSKHEPRVGVCKPLATGCRSDRSNLVSEDSEALAHFAGCRESLDVINPIRFRDPLAPAVAAQRAGRPMDYAKIARSLEQLDRTHDLLLVEGIGGVMVPIDPLDPELTVLELIRAIGYPVVVVTRAGLGTLNHTAMTVRVLKQAGCRIVGIVINYYEADSSGCLEAEEDLAMTTNRFWLTQQTGVEVLVTVPQCPVDAVRPQNGNIPGPILDAMGTYHWPAVMSTPSH